MVQVIEKTTRRSPHLCSRAQLGFRSASCQVCLIPQSKPCFCNPGYFQRRPADSVGQFLLTLIRNGLCSKVCALEASEEPTHGAQTRCSDTESRALRPGVQRPPALCRGCLLPPLRAAPSRPHNRARNLIKYYLHSIKRVEMWARDHSLQQTDFKQRND